MIPHLAQKDLTPRLPQTAVIDKPKRLRVAVGVFDRVGLLAASLRELSERNIPASSLVLLCPSRVLEDKADPAQGGAEISTLAKSSALFVRKGNEILRANAGPESGDLAPHEEIVHLERWIEPRMAARLTELLSHSTSLLFGIAQTPEQEQAICDVLIKHSVGQVQVHDFRICSVTPEGSL